MKRDEQHERPIETTLFLTTSLTYAYFYQASDQSIAARFDLIRSILERHTLWIDGYCGYNTADIITLGGHYYSVKAPGTSLTGLVPWRLVTWLLRPLASRNEPLFWAFATYLTIVLSVSLLVACLVVVMYRFARALDASPARSAAVALITGLATILFPYATELTGEPVAAACLLTAFYLLATFADDPHWGRATFAGFLAGWAVLNDFPSLLVAIALAFYALWKLPRRGQLAAFSAGAAAVATVLFLYNWGAFRSPFFMSYEAYKLAENQQFPEQAVGYVGLTYPRIPILWNVLVDPQRGLFFCNPVLLMVVPGLVYFWRSDRRAEFFVTLEAIAVFVLFNASFGESIISWGGGTATGPRQMAPAIPFMTLTLVFVPAALDWFVGALAMLSALLMLAATSTNPHFPYEYANPVRDFALQHFFRGDFSFNRDTYFGGPMTIFGDSVAFNLGRLVGLPGPLELVPLALFWMGAAANLIADLRVWPEPKRMGLGLAAALLAIAALFVPPLTGPLTHEISLARPHGLLGRYFLGNIAGAGPWHLERVDPEINFANVAELGAMPFPSVVVWTGTLIVSTTGPYGFRLQADDVGWLKIDGRDVIRDPGSVMRLVSVGAIVLTAGPHRILVGERNIAGDSSVRLYWLPPDGQPELVPSRLLIPDRDADHAAFR